MLVVKADAYGHGAVAIAHHAVRCGVGALALGLLRRPWNYVRAAFGPQFWSWEPSWTRSRTGPSTRGGDGIHSSDRVQMLAKVAKQLGCVARVHLNIDTGMGRLGVLPERAISLLEEIREATNLDLRGVMTHVSSAKGALDPESSRQVQAFEAVLAAARRRDLLQGWIHVANSAAIFTGLAAGYDTVRPGISAYGILPGGLPAHRNSRPP